MRLQSTHGNKVSGTRNRKQPRHRRRDVCCAREKCILRVSIKRWYYDDDDYICYVDEIIRYCIIIVGMLMPEREKCIKLMLFEEKNVFTGKIPT